MKNIKIKLTKWIAKQKNLPEVLEGYIINQTENAIKMEYLTTSTIWLPKSQIEIIEEKEREV